MQVTPVQGKRWGAWALENAVDHTLTDQTSVIGFVEDNWLGGQRIGQGLFDGIASPIN
jgi:phospholipase C